MIEPLHIERSNQFKRDYKKAKKQGKNLLLLYQSIDHLCNHKPLPVKFRDHALFHNWHNYRELHLSSDWLLIYQLVIEKNLLRLARLGSHTEIFKI